jgi:hypothetical protein
VLPNLKVDDKLQVVVKADVGSDLVGGIRLPTISSILGRHVPLQIKDWAADLRAAAHHFG